MDKKVLVAETKRIIQSFIDEGHTIDFAALSPFRPDLFGDDRYYTLNVKADFLNAMRETEAANLLIERKHEILAPEHRGWIHGYEIIKEGDTVVCPLSLVLISSPDVEVVPYQPYRTLSRFDVLDMLFP